jgi:hypothetical protein
MIPAKCEPVYHPGMRRLSFCGDRNEPLGILLLLHSAPHPYKIDSGSAR